METDIYRQFYEFERDHWWSKGMRYLCKAMIDKFAGLGKDDAVILDIGCGTGEMSRSLDMTGRVFAADYSDEAIAFCRKRGIRHLIRTSAEASGFRGGSFSLVVAFCLIEHIDDDGLFLKEMNRILKPGGSIVILTSAFQFLWSEHDEVAHHKRRYRLGSLKKLMNDNGFSIKKASYVNSLLFPAVALIRMVQRCFHLHTASEKKFVLDIVRLPRLCNDILYGILVAEVNILRYINMPFGVGIVCVGQKSPKE